MSLIPHRFNGRTSVPDILSLLDQNFDALDDQDRTKIINNAGVPQILFGYQNGGFGALDYGLKVSKVDPATGKPFDVTNATDDQLYFSSAFNNLKVVSTGTIELTVPGGYTPGATFQEVVPHGLGRTPAVIAFVQVSSAYYPIPHLGFVYSAPDSALLVDPVWDVIVDDTNVTAYFSSGSTLFNGSIYTYRYYLLAETAN